jgi:type I restriction enzyme M protein
VFKSAVAKRLRTARGGVLKLKNKDDKLVWPEAHDYNKGKRRFKSDLVPATILVARYFGTEQKAIENVDASPSI